MSISLVTPINCPVPPYTTELIDIDTQSVPMLLYGIWLKASKYYWSSSDDWKVARTLLAKQGASLLMPGTIDLINAVDRLYTLIDVRTAGIERTVSGDGTSIDPYVYDPPLFQTPEIFDDEPRSLIGFAVSGKRAWRNLLNGTDSDEFADTRNFRQQLDDLIAQDAGDDADMATLLAFAEANGIDLLAILAALA